MQAAKPKSKALNPCSHACFSCSQAAAIAMPASAKHAAARLLVQLLLGVYILVSYVMCTACLPLGAVTD
jgi:hypothetical protein